MDRKIFLVRHGQIDLGSEKRYIGITDLPLNNVGIRQAARLKKYFAAIEIEKVFTSPLKRCLQTSEILLEGKNAVMKVIDELKEINMGDWESQTINDIKDHFGPMYEQRGANIDTFIPPGGESFKQLQNRVMPVFDYIAANTAGNTIIISHAGVNRVILSKLLNFPLQNIFKIKQPYGCINLLSWDMIGCSWQYKLIRINEKGVEI